MRSLALNQRPRSRRHLCKVPEQWLCGPSLGERMTLVTPSSFDARVDRRPLWFYQIQSPPLPVDFFNNH